MLVTIGLQCVSEDWRAEVELHLFLTPECWILRRGRFTRGEWRCGVHWTGGWVLIVVTSRKCVADCCDEQKMCCAGMRKCLKLTREQVTFDWLWRMQDETFCTRGNIRKGSAILSVGPTGGSTLSETSGCSVMSESVTPLRRLPECQHKSTFWNTVTPYITLQVSRHLLWNVKSVSTVCGLNWKLRNSSRRDCVLNVVNKK
jgi:hypothetical protein